MIYTEWMSYIKDEIPLTQVVIPGAHNAGSYGMGKMAQCQRHGLRTQFEYGVRQFCLRLNTDRKSNRFFYRSGCFIIYLFVILKAIYTV